MLKLSDRYICLATLSYSPKPTVSGKYHRFKINLTDADNFTASLICLSFQMVNIIKCKSPNSPLMAITGLPPLCWAITLSFECNCSTLLLPRGRRHRWEFCRHDEIFVIQKKLVTAHCRISIVYSCDCMAYQSCGLLLLLLSNITREYCTVFYYPGKKNQNSEVRFLLNAYHFHTTVELYFKITIINMLKDAAEKVDKIH